MKKIKLGRLQLNPQTIRVLSDASLREAHGAGPRSAFGCSGSCNTCYVSNCCDASQGDCQTYGCASDSCVYTCNFC